MLYASPWSRFKLTTSVLCCKSNYHKIMATTAPKLAMYKTKKDESSQRWKKRKPPSTVPQYPHLLVVCTKFDPFYFQIWKKKKKSDHWWKKEESSYIVPQYPRWLAVWTKFDPSDSARHLPTYFSNCLEELYNNSQFVRFLSKLYWLSAITHARRLTTLSTPCR